MSARLDLTPEEREELARLLGEDTLGALLRGWSDLVTQVERGYDDSIYEYTNDLFVRTRLDEVAAGASPGLRAQLERRARRGRPPVHRRDGGGRRGRSASRAGRTACRRAASASWPRTSSARLTRVSRL